MGDDPQKASSSNKTRSVNDAIVNVILNYALLEVVEEYKFMLEKSQSFFAGLRCFQTLKVHKKY